MQGKICDKTQKPPDEIYLRFSYEVCSYNCIFHRNFVCVSTFFI